MRVLIACEESQTVCKAFRALGHEAYSCDIVECSGGHPEWHLQQDVLPLLKMKWDLIIAHPPCTYMSKAGARWMYPKAGVLSEERYQQAMKAKDFFMQFYNCSCEHIAIENPVPLKVVNLPPPRRKSSPTSSASLTARQRSFGSKDCPSCSRRKYSRSIRLGCHRTREVSLAERVAAVASLTTLARQVRLSTASPRQWPSNGRNILAISCDSKFFTLHSKAMNQTIFLPSDDETRQLMENAWQEFQQQAVSHLAAEAMKTTNE